MKRITIDIPDIIEPTTDVSVFDVSLLLRDALYEFSHRSGGPDRPARAHGQGYIDWRYPSPTYSEEFRANKLKSVARRVKLAEELAAFAKIDMEAAE